MGKAIKLTTESFIEKARKVHGDKYDYSKVEYKGSKSKVIIICPIHGEFEQRSSNHLVGIGCRMCGFKSVSDKHRCTLEQFIEKARSIHGDKYDYSKVNYKNSKTKVTIICPIHGEFEQIPNSHLQGLGCAKCGIETTTKSISYTKEQFIKRAREIHGNKYDYSKVKYDNIQSKITIICSKHGEFHQIAANHIKGNKCRKCVIENRTYGIDEFIKRARKVHGNKYDYSKVKYNSVEDKIIIICKKHGEFTQSVCAHVGKRHNGCPKCALGRESLRLTKEEFINRAKRVHGDKYDYSEVNYVSLMNKIIIICKKHSKFSQRAGHHLSGSGCPSCPSTISSGHQDIIDFIKSVDPDIELKINDREAIKPNELDIYVPQHNFAIEYHGLYWHSFDRPESMPEKKKHQQKHKLCLDRGMKLFQIFENEWISERTKDILKSKIKLSFGISNKIYARKCVVKEITSEEYKEFIAHYHLQGHKSASVRLGLFHQDELVSVMSFNKHPKYEWEITRFASKLNMIVVGGASKIFRYFINNYDPNQILTYADCRYSNGNLYQKLGFKLDGITQPNYYYIKDDQIFSRQQFQKHKLHKKLEFFNPDQTETENMFNNGYRRMWDAGHFRFVWKK